MPRRPPEQRVYIPVGDDEPLEFGDEWTYEDEPIPKHWATINPSAYAYTPNSLNKVSERKLIFRREIDRLPD